jgi:hypothetical protein
MWFLASRKGATGETEHVLFHDYSDSATQAVRTDYAKNNITNVLKGTSPVWKAYQNYMKACIGMKGKIEQAGFSIILGPTSKAGCTNRIQP